jgi:hypothetical protein
MRWIHGPWPTDLVARCLANEATHHHTQRLAQSQWLCDAQGCDGIVPIAVRVLGNRHEVHSRHALQPCTVCGGIGTRQPIPRSPSAHTLLRVARHLSHSPTTAYSWDNAHTR